MRHDQSPVRLAVLATAVVAAVWAVATAIITAAVVRASRAGARRRWRRQRERRLVEAGCSPLLFHELVAHIDEARRRAPRSPELVGVEALIDEYVRHTIIRGQLAAELCKQPRAPRLQASPVRLAVAARRNAWQEACAMRVRALDELLEDTAGLLRLHAARAILPGRVARCDAA
jgi:hypothetical protein